MSEFIGITLRGLEDLAAREVKGSVVCSGRVKCSVLPKELFLLDTVYEYVSICEASGVDRIVSEVIKVRLTSPCRVTCRREGSHEFRSGDVEMACALALKSKGCVVNVKEFKEVVFVDVLEERCFVGKLIKEELGKKEYRVKLHNQAVPAILAQGALRVAGVNEQDVVYDPFCKDGVIAVEAALLGCKRVLVSDPRGIAVRNALINAQMAGVNLEEANEKGRENVTKVVTCMISSKKSVAREKEVTGFFNVPVLCNVRSLVVITNNAESIKEYAQAKYALESERSVMVGKAVMSVLQFAPRGAGAPLPTSL